MNKILKQTLVALLAIVVLASLNTTFAVTAGFIKLQNGVSVKAGEECTVSVNFEGLSTDTDDVEFGGTIDYDKDKLELVSITTSGNWDKATEGRNYAISTGKFTFGADEKVEANSKAFDITFKAKEGVEGTATVTLKDIDISGGGNFADASTTVEIRKEAQTPSGSDNTAGENNTVAGGNTAAPDTNNNTQTPAGNKNNTVNNGTNRNNTTKNDTTTNNQTIPKAGNGANFIMPIITVALIALVVFFYIQNRRVDKKINDLNKKD